MDARLGRRPRRRRPVVARRQPALQRRHPARARPARRRARPSPDAGDGAARGRPSASPPPPGSRTYGIPSLKVALLGRGRGGRARCRRRCSSPAPRRVGAGAHRAPRRAGRATATPSRCSPWPRQASASAARCCAARWPAGSTPAASPRPASTRRPARGARPRRLGPPPTPPCSPPAERVDGRRMAVVAVHLVAPAKLTALAAGHRRAGRRLPPDRRRDGQPRPGRRARRSSTATAAGRASTLRSSTPPPAARTRSDADRQPRARGRWRWPGGTAHGAAHASASRAGAGLGGGSSDAAAILRWAGCRPTWTRPPRSAPTSPSASSAAGPGCGASARSSSRSPFEARTLTLLTPPFGCSTPAVYRAWDELGGPTARRARTTSSPRRWPSSPGWPAYRDRLGDATGQTPRLAGSGSTWFVEGAHPGAGPRRHHHRPSAGRRGHSRA